MPQAVSDNMVRRLAELDTLEADRREALAAANEAARLLDAMRRNMQDQVGGHAALCRCAAWNGMAASRAHRPGRAPQRFPLALQQVAGDQADQAGTSAAHARQGLESQLRQARSQLYVARLDTERRRRNIARNRRSVSNGQCGAARQAPGLNLPACGGRRTECQLLHSPAAAAAL